MVVSDGLLLAYLHVGAVFSMLHFVRLFRSSRLVGGATLHKDVGLSLHRWVPCLLVSLQAKVAFCCKLGQEQSYPHEHSIVRNISRKFLYKNIVLVMPISCTYRNHSLPVL
jgi:hypothetical protein